MNISINSGNINKVKVIINQLIEFIINTKKTKKKYTKGIKIQ